MMRKMKMMRTSLVLCGILAGMAAIAYGAEAQAPGGGEAEARSACASRVYPPNPPNKGILFVDHAKNNRGGHLGHALVQYAPGKILAFYPNTNPGHSAVGWMEFKRSEDGGQTWSDPQELAFTKELFEKKTGRTAMAEKAVVTDKGEIVLFFLVCDVSQNELWRPYWVPLVSRSSDAGKTWSEPKPVTASRGRIYDAIYQDGEIRVLHFANDATNEEASHVWCGSKEEHVYELYVSTDGGETFAKRSVLPFETLGRGYGSLGQLGESDLIAFVWRHDRENVLEYVISQDGGKTWSKTGTSTVSRKIWNPQFIAFDGKYYLHGRSGGGPGGHMILYMSQDGVTWDDGVYLRMNEAGYGAYSNSIVVDAPDGSGKQRLLIQASHAYNKSHATNVLHWWLESETAKSSKGKGETLYNGIVLPQTWPPGNMDRNSDDPMPVPYLDSPPEIIPIDLGRQLFVDDFLVEKTDMERVFHKPVVYEKNPVLTPLRKEGSIVAIMSGGVFWNPEKNRFEMYFISGEFNHRSLNLATSQDMIQWKRTDVEGDNGSVIFEPGKWVPGDELAGTRGAIHVVILDLEAKDPAERYKMLIQRSWDGKHTHVLRTSPDLVQWSEGIPAGPGHDTSEAFYNPFRKKWVFSIKGQQGSGEGPGELGRLRLYSEKDSFTEGNDWSDKVFWTRADRLDLPEPADGYPDHPEEGGRPQLYNLHAMPYESLMVGLFEIHRGPHNNVCEKGRFPKLTDINVGFSRDGFHWDRPDRSGFINSTRKEGSWHKGYTRGTTSVCVVFEDKLIFPFTGFSGTDPFTGGKGMYTGAAIGIASLRRDGFASMRAGEEHTGTLTTRRVTFTDEYLFVNVDNPVGGLKVEVLDEAGKVIPGFSLEDCNPISADSTKAMITWKKNKSLKALAGEPVRFRFSLQSGDLYAFWVSKTEAGHSGGYLAGGGPGYKGHRDMAE